MKKLIIAAAIILFAGTAFSQTLQKGGILSVQTLKISLDPDVTWNQYLDFTMNTYIPEAEKAFQGVKVFVMIGGIKLGSIGEAKEEYNLIYYWESEEAANKYFDAGGNLTDEGTAAMEKLGPTFEKGEKLGTNSSDLLVWVIL